MDLVVSLLERKSSQALFSANNNFLTSTEENLVSKKWKLRPFIPTKELNSQVKRNSSGTPAHRNTRTHTHAHTPNTYTHTHDEFTRSSQRNSVTHEERAKIEKNKVADKKIKDVVKSITKQSDLIAKLRAYNRGDVDADGEIKKTIRKLELREGDNKKSESSSLHTHTSSHTRTQTHSNPRVSTTHTHIHRHTDDGLDDNVNHVSFRSGGEMRASPFFHMPVGTNNNKNNKNLKSFKNSTRTPTHTKQRINNCNNNNNIRHNNNNNKGNEKSKSENNNNTSKYNNNNKINNNRNSTNGQTYTPLNRNKAKQKAKPVNTVKTQLIGGIPQPVLPQNSLKMYVSEKTLKEKERRKSAPEMHAYAHDYDDDEYEEDFIDDDTDEGDWRSAIRSITGYDPSQYAEADNDQCVESSALRQLAEEKRSAAIGNKEDAIELEMIQREAEMEKRARAAKRRRKS